MKEQNIGKLCLVKGIKLIKTAHGGWPNEKDYVSFLIVGIIKGGYRIQDYQGNTHEIKSKLIKIC